jgi:phosphoribosylformylglycinamidine cyclo-ligase
MKRGMMKEVTYRDAGVDLSEYGALVGHIVRRLGGSFEASRQGLFAGAVEVRGAGRGGLLVSSIDGVGTKVKVATAFGRHSGIGRDIVAHCVNDILAVGARPVAFLDYVGFSKLDTAVFKKLISGMVRECRRHEMVLLGGETAEMPGVYHDGEYDLVGCIMGFARKRDLLDGSRIKKGDLIIGLPSNGLHTNGYSLAREVLLRRRRMKLGARPAGLRTSLGKALLKPHTSYFHEVYPLVEKRIVKGIAHITGGGIPGNLCRILPSGCGARLKSGLWRVPPIFELIQAKGPVKRDEMFRVFNMGLGMLLVATQARVPDILKRTASARIVGEVVEGDGAVVIE